MTYEKWFRIALGYLGAFVATVGVWALLFPRSFYDDFPAIGGMAWVNVDGPYNEHLLRDLGATNLAILVVVVVAAIRLTRTLVVTAALASLAWGVPHLVYHIFATDGLSTTDLVFNFVALVTYAATPVLLLAMRNHLPVATVASESIEPAVAEV